MERTKSSQISSQCISLQFKLAQEKATKSIKSTAASLSSSIQKLSQDLFVKKTDPTVVNEGYSQFIKKYEEDMQHLEGLVRDLEASYQRTTSDWVGLDKHAEGKMASEEAHRKRQADLLEENKALRKEKNELEQALRSVVAVLLGRLVDPGAGGEQSGAGGEAGAGADAVQGVGRCV